MNVDDLERMKEILGPGICVRCEGGVDDEVAVIGHHRPGFSDPHSEFGADAALVVVEVVQDGSVGEWHDFDRHASCPALA